MEVNPSTTLYTLGRGIVSIGTWSGTTPPVSYTDVGNSPSFEVEITEEKLEHKLSRTGTGTIDKEVILLTGYTANFVLDEISVANLAKFLKGTISGALSHIVSANTALTNEYAIKFVSDNPAGPNETWEFWRVTLSPNGAFNLISDEWAQLPFTAKGLSAITNNASSTSFTVTFATTTTTTTNTTT